MNPNQTKTDDLSAPASGSGPVELPNLVKKREGSFANWCVHYNGIAKCETCDAGVQYAAVARDVEHTYSYGARGHRYKMGRVWPCFRDDLPLAYHCEKQQFPTAGEIKKHDEEVRQHLNGMFGAREAILADLKRRHAEGDSTVKMNGHSECMETDTKNYISGSGRIECPVCKKGTLKYSRAGYNGHVHAKCSTAGCVAWIE